MTELNETEETRPEGGERDAEWVAMMTELALKIRDHDRTPRPQNRKWTFEETAAVEREIAALGALALHAMRQRVVVNGEFPWSVIRDVYEIAEADAEATGERSGELESLVLRYVAYAAMAEALGH